MRLTILAGVLLLIACGGGSDGGNTAADTLTRRQRDSAIGELRLPGAQGIRGALRAADSIAARNARLDSLNRQN